VTSTHCVFSPGWEKPATTGKREQIRKRSKMIRKRKQQQQKTRGKSSRWTQIPSTQISTHCEHGRSLHRPHTLRWTKSVSLVRQTFIQGKEFSVCGSWHVHLKESARPLSLPCTDLILHYLSHVTSLFATWWQINIPTTHQTSGSEVSMVHQGGRY